MQNPHAEASSNPLWEKLSFLLFGITQGLCSFLLFSIQPLAARMLLPRFGGSPTVWIVCLSFFQTILVVGYIFAHWIRGQPFRQLGAYSYPFLILLGLSWIWVVPLSIMVGGEAPYSSSLAPFHLLGILAFWIGPPLIILSSSSPMLQALLASSRHSMRANPYPLYSISNGLSILALLSYPILIEPLLGLRAQYRLWTMGLSIAILLLVSCFIWSRIYRVRSKKGVSSRTSRIQNSTRSYLTWILWAAIPAIYLPAITLYFSTDLLSVPLLWVLPLFLYLASFVVVFSNRFEATKKILDFIYRVFAFGALLILIALVSGIGQPLLFFIPLHFSVFFVACLYVHGKVVSLKPEPQFLTHFYVSIAIGGMLGGLFVALAAPVLFSEISEYPLAILLIFFLSWSDWRQLKNLSWLSKLNPVLVAGVIFGGMYLISISGWEPDSRLSLFALTIIPGLLTYRYVKSPIIYGLSLAALFILVHYSVSTSSTTIHRSRSFFGTVKIIDDGKFKKMIHGNTLHGLQSIDPSLSRNPGSYYARSGPIGDIIAMLQEKRVPSNVGVVGLGVGALSAYAERGESWTFFELNPEISKIAYDTALFSYLNEANRRSYIQIVLGDARLTLASEMDHRFDLLVLDAFSSDGIPFHLLTREALELYWQKTKASGLIVFHISNRYFDFSGPLSNLADSFDAQILIRDDKVENDETKSGFKTTSVWVVISKNEEQIKWLLQKAGWVKLHGTGELPWSDDYMNLFEIFKR
ncbi:MAG: hypothetical protein AB7F66_09010 [Bacteriovoracia bacterium]